MSGNVARMVTGYAAPRMQAPIAPVHRAGYATPIAIVDAPTRLAYPYTWHTGETATAFRVQVARADGSSLGEISGASLTVVSLVDGSTLIDDEACDSLDGGLLVYTPSDSEMATACTFRALFTVTYADASTDVVSVTGEIEASL